MSKEHPTSLLEFEHWFRTEEACREYLVRLRWPHGFECPRCGHKHAWRTQRGLFHCGGCRKDVSVTAGTIFHGSHICLRLWFRAMWWITNQKGGINALGLQRTLGLGGYKTAWSCLHRLRRAMVRPGRERLSGSVEIDETLVGGFSRGRGGIGSKTVVGIAAEIRGSGTGRIRLAQLPDSRSQSLTGFIKEAVLPGSEIVTDGAWAYQGLGALGYRHTPVVLDGKGKQASVHFLPRVHRVAALLKRWLLGIHHGRVSKKQLAAYLEEFSFRFNRRLSPDRGMLFRRLVEHAVLLPHVTYEAIVKSR